MTATVEAILNEIQVLSENDLEILYLVIERKSLIFKNLTQK